MTYGHSQRQFQNTSYVAQCLTGIAVFPNADTERRECGSVEVAYDVERVGPMSWLLEVKQEYFAPILCGKALSNNRDELRLKTKFFRYVSLLRPQRFPTIFVVDIYVVDDCVDTEVGYRRRRRRLKCSIVLLITKTNGHQNLPM